VDSNIYGRSVSLLPVDAIDVNDKLLSVAGGDFAFTVLEGSTSDQNLIVLADGHGSDVVLGLQILGKVCAHDDAAFVGWRIEVSLTALSSGRSDIWVELHFDLDDVGVCVVGGRVILK